jgi:autotransporter-associated beta strand protein
LELEQIDSTGKVTIENSVVTFTEDLLGNSPAVVQADQLKVVSSTLRLESGSRTAPTQGISLTNEVVFDVGGDSVFPWWSDLALSGPLSGSGGFAKIGSGTMELAGSMSYQGDTEVREGQLVVWDSNFNDSSDVRLVSDGTGAPLLQLFSFDPSTDIIKRLVIDGVPQATGLWGEVGNAGADFTSPLIIGAGLLEVTDSSAPTRYDQWIANYFPPGMDRAFNSDPGKSGFDNGVRYFIGIAPGDPVIYPPSASRAGSRLRFTYRQHDRALNITDRVQYSLNLKDWIDAVPGVNGVTTRKDPIPGEPDIDLVTVNILHQNASAIFVRLVVEQ